MHLFHKAGSRASVRGPSENFSGDVRIDPLFQSAEPGRAAGASVTFAPGARSAWHTHPLGQTLIVISGHGLVKGEGEPARALRPGDVVQCPANHRHWHGAMPDTSMTHIAIQEALDGRVVDWLAKVTDEEYESAAESAK